MSKRRRDVFLCLVIALAACKKGEDKPAPLPTTPAEPASGAPAAGDPPAAAAPEEDGCKDRRNNQGIAACEKSCDAGSAKACTWAGYLHQEEDDEAVADTNAIKLFQKACEKSDAYGCHEVGVYYRGGLGGLPKDEAKSKEYFAKALPMFEKECAAGNAGACEKAKAAPAP